MFLPQQTADVSANTAIPALTSSNNQLPYLANNTMLLNQFTDTNTMNYSSVERLLEKEKMFNKTEPWNKLDKTVKIQKLHAFSEKYGREQGLPAKEIKTLKLFFVECLDKGKLQKTKDVVYNKDDREITSIPALFFNTEKKHFTLRILDAKRVSTLKSLTPKRVTERNKEEE
jgi:hypothetical protein